ncbi:MAG: hypothetical protein DSZ04_02985 [Sulfurimonas sp.]|nr:MAG: hypothetical protein DSZ04_02985 [Sulfurimonas sp.]
MIKFNLVVTRHQGLVDYLLAEGLIDDDTRVVTHASKRDVLHKHVIGVLPHSLSAMTKTFSEIPLDLPPEMRGKELSVADIRLYKGVLTTYCVYIPDSDILNEFYPDQE